MLRPESTTAVSSTRAAGRQRKEKKNKQRQMDASYEVLGASDRDSASDATSEGEMDEEVNGEEVRVQMEGFQQSQILRTVIAGIGFMMSVIGIWGDGSADVVIIEMSA